MHLIALHIYILMGNFTATMRWTNSKTGMRWTPFYSALRDKNSNTQKTSSKVVMTGWLNLFRVCCRNRMYIYIGQSVICIVLDISRAFLLHNEVYFQHNARFFSFFLLNWVFLERDKKTHILVSYLIAIYYAFEIELLLAHLGYSFLYINNIYFMPKCMLSVDVCEGLTYFLTFPPL